ncbi:hypothetical protein CJF32_00005533 [Rutstroemia sp. NJR-2017a WRK4]|nr:hypothetical protein CJF32_00005533 [Rutstroemia sp. NJR-2017a WRK4]
MKSLIPLVSFLLLPTLLLASSVPAPTATATFTTLPSAASSSSSLLRKNGTSTSNLNLNSNPTSTTSFKANPLITAAPTPQEVELQQKYHQTTYWSCVTMHTHEPLLAGGTEIAGAPCGRCAAGRARPVVAAAGVVAAVWGVL